jgi:3-methylfumaryl-CoA hydratase
MSGSPSIAIEMVEEELTERTLDIDRLKKWVGKSQRVHDAISLPAVKRIRDFYSLSPDVADGDALMELWHWFFFNMSFPPERMGTDGHLEPGDFLPPIALPRRMWGGSRLRFLRPFVAGRDAEKVSRVVSVDLKEGSTGQLGVVRVAHDILQDGELCLSEEQDIVYRQAASGSPSQAGGPACPEGATHRQVIAPNPVMLFQYSALTYNAHRIHYDRDYATGIEGYGGLVVHGPLIASLLAQFAREIVQKPLKTFSFRGLSPLLDDEAFTLEAKESSETLDLWVRQPQGGQAMQASATF